MELTDDIKPIYLGYEVSTKTYYFYFIKEGVPRFLVYVTYFYWGKGPQTVLSLVPVPPSVEEELEQFLSGNLSYEFIKVRKNSKQASIKKLYRLPQQVGRGAIAVVAGDGGGTAGRGTSVPGNPITEGGANGAGVPVKKRRRTKQEMSQIRASLDLQIQSKKRIEKKEIPTSEPVVKLRKRRTKAEILTAKTELKKLPATSAADVVAEKSETTNVKKKKKPTH